MSLEYGGARLGISEASPTLQAIAECRVSVAGAPSVLGALPVNSWELNPFSFNSTLYS
jgi:hypothetical protein